MNDADTGEQGSPLDRAVPPLDAVDSRWWYWIAAYPIAMVLFVPLMVVATVLFLIPVTVVESGGQPMPAPRVSGAVVGVVFMLLVVAFVIVAFVVALVLPVALYMDARAVSRAGLDWTPDPLLYGLLGILQFLVTPVVGVVVAVYYLYRRHEHVGVP